jgi:hypothetical protein
VRVLCRHLVVAAEPQLLHSLNVLMMCIQKGPVVNAPGAVGRVCWAVGGVP